MAQYSNAPYPGTTLAPAQATPQGPVQLPAHLANKTKSSAAKARFLGGIGGNNSNRLGTDNKIFMAEVHGVSHPLSHMGGEISVIILGCNESVSRMKYTAAFVRGEETKPLCYSMDGREPSVFALNKQAGTCAMCQWSNKNLPAEHKCRQHKILAVLVRGREDLGPLALKVSSLGLFKDRTNGAVVLDQYGRYTSHFTEYPKTVERFVSPHIELSDVYTVLSFDPQETGPVLQFSIDSTSIPGQVAFVQPDMAAFIAEHYAREEPDGTIWYCDMIQQFFMDPGVLMHGGVVPPALPAPTDVAAAPSAAVPPPPPAPFAPTMAPPPPPPPAPEQVQWFHGKPYALRNGQWVLQEPAAPPAATLAPPPPAPAPAPAPPATSGPVTVTAPPPAEPAKRTGRKAATTAAPAPTPAPTPAPPPAAVMPGAPPLMNEAQLMQVIDQLDDT